MLHTQEKEMHLIIENKQYLARMRERWTSRHMRNGKGDIGTMSVDMNREDYAPYARERNAPDHREQAIFS